MTRTEKKRLHEKFQPIFEINSESPEATLQIAEYTGRLLSERTLIGLDGEPGAGKTEFVRGFAAGAGVGSDCYITSPTYSIINAYMGRLPFYHLDLYRLSDPDELYDTGIEDILEERAFIVVEWPELLKHIADFDIIIKIVVTGMTSRKISFFGSGLVISNLLRKLPNQILERV